MEKSGKIIEVLEKYINTTLQKGHLARQRESAKRVLEKLKRHGT